MRVVYYTSGTTGTGRIVLAISIANSIARRNLIWDFVILSSTPFASLADAFGIQHIEIPLENDSALSPINYAGSILFKTIKKLKPDLLLVDRMWFTLYNFIDELECKKVFLSIQVPDEFFKIKIPDRVLQFRRSQYDRILAIEPFESCIDMEQINPVIIRNRDEIYERKIALDKLGLDGKRRVCLVALNYKEGYLEKLRRKYSYLEDEYQMLYSTNMKGGGIFPIVDYFNAIDLLVGAASYLQFWEAIYFEKEAIFDILPLYFSSMKWRIDKCSDYEFDENGADQMVDIMLNL